MLKLLVEIPVCFVCVRNLNIIKAYIWFSTLQYYIVIVDVPYRWFSTCLATAGDVTSVRFTCKTSRYMSRKIY